MAKVGRYCKAYPVNRFREFNHWNENLQNLRKEKKTVDGKEVEVTRELIDNDFFYLQDNYTVTDGIFLDQNVIFDSVTPEWQDFCISVLDFNVPVYETTA
jgi:hypothetical protein